MTIIVLALKAVILHIVSRPTVGLDYRGHETYYSIVLYSTMDWRGNIL